MQYRASDFNVISFVYLSFHLLDRLHYIIEDAKMSSRVLPLFSLHDMVSVLISKILINFNALLCMMLIKGLHSLLYMWPTSFPSSFIEDTFFVMHHKFWLLFCLLTIYSRCLSLDSHFYSIDLGIFLISVLFGILSFIVYFKIGEGKAFNLCL